MNTTKCPSKIPIRFGLFLIVICAPLIFILGFGANKRHQMKPQKTAMTVIESKNNAVVLTKKGEETFIYADVYTVYRSDATYKVQDIDGKEIPTTVLNNQKPIVYAGCRISDEFSPIASFISTGDSVRVYCNLTSDTNGEFLVGAKLLPPSISILMLFFFAVGIIIMIIGIVMGIRNINARTKWNEQNGIHWYRRDFGKYF